MEHLNIPNSCDSPSLTVPYLGVAPAYDRRGFDGFPERHGFDVLQFTQVTQESLKGPASDSDPLAREYIESFIQEWLWFGALHEFEIACGLPMDSNSYIKPDDSS